MPTNITNNKEFFFFKKSKSLEVSLYEIKSPDHLTMEETQTIEILIVDDIKVNRKLLSRAFCNLNLKAGNQVFQIKLEEAENGQEAVNKIRERSNSNQKPFDIVFMDIEMPVMNGYDATKEILDGHQQLPIIAYTNVPKEECLKMQPSFKDYMTKGRIKTNELDHILNAHVLSQKNTSEEKRDTSASSSLLCLSSPAGSSCVIS